MSAPYTRSTLTAALAAAPALSGWTIYAEPPEQLAAGRCLVVAPRSPYLAYESFARVSSALAITLLVPRTQGPAMDTIDAGLLALWGVLEGLADVEIGDQATVGLIEGVGAVEYIAASINVICH